MNDRKGSKTKKVGSQRGVEWTSSQGRIARKSRKIEGKKRCREECWEKGRGGRKC